MRTPRAVVPGSIAAGQVLDLPRSEALHLVSVLRREPGDEVLLHAADGTVHRSRITGTGVDHEGPWARVKVLDELPPAGPVVLPWTAAVAITKGESFELALRMASELGLERVLPVVCARSVARAPAGTQKAARWERIARESAKQCGRAAPLAVETPRSLRSLLEGDPSPRGWIALPGEAFAAAQLPGRRDRATFLVGPEGGFTPEEAAAALKAGFQPLGFPTPVLRTPTAVALIAALGLMADGEGPREGGDGSVLSA